MNDMNQLENPFSDPEIEKGYQKYLSKNPRASRTEFLEKRKAVIDSPAFSKAASTKKIVSTLEGVIIPVTHLSFEEAENLNAESRRLSM